MATEFDIVLKDKKGKTLKRGGASPHDITAEDAKALFEKCNTFGDLEIVSIMEVDTTDAGKGAIATAQAALKSDKVKAATGDPK